MKSAKTIAIILLLVLVGGFFYVYNNPQNNPVIKIYKTQKDEYAQKLSFLWPFDGWDDTVYSPGKVIFYWPWGLERVYVVKKTRRTYTWGNKGEGDNPTSFDVVLGRSQDGHLLQYYLTNHFFYENNIPRLAKLYFNEDMAGKDGIYRIEAKTLMQDVVTTISYLKGGEITVEEHQRPVRFKIFSEASDEIDKVLRPLGIRQEKLNLDNDIVDGGYSDIIYTVNKWVQAVDAKKREIDVTEKKVKRLLELAKQQAALNEAKIKQIEDACAARRERYEKILAQVKAVESAKYNAIYTTLSGDIENFSRPGAEEYIEVLFGQAIAKADPRVIIMDIENKGMNLLNMGDALGGFLGQTEKRTEAETKPSTDYLAKSATQGWGTGRIPIEEQIRIWTKKIDKEIDELLDFKNNEIIDTFFKDMSIQSPANDKQVDPIKPAIESNSGLQPPVHIGPQG